MLNNNKKQETQFFGTKCGNANSIAAGYATETTNYGEIATGILNKSTKGDNPNSPEGVVGDPKATLFSVGCGTKEERKNALEVKGDGSVIISGKGGSDIKSVQEIINGKADITPIITSTDTVVTLQPNKKYDITVDSTLTLMLAEPSDKTTNNEYLCSINIGASIPTITFPKEITWNVEPVIEANKHYEINVQYSHDRYWGTVHSYEFPNDEVVLDETKQYIKPVLFAKNSNVTLKRKLKTGQENSLCLPFAMTQEQISEIWGANTEIYYVSGSDAKKIYFNTTTNIEAGFPCLIKPERINTNNVYNIHNVPASSWYSKDTIPEYIGENIRSVGFFSPSVVKAGSYVFSGGKLYHLTSDMNSKGFRIYFEDLV